MLRLILPLKLLTEIHLNHSLCIVSNSGAAFLESFFESLSLPLPFLRVVAHSSPHYKTLSREALRDNPNNGHEMN